MLRTLVIAILLGAAPANANANAATAARQSGTLVAATPLAGAPGGAAAWRIRYRSLGTDNRPVTISGVVIVPAGPVPRGGRDIIAWTHGTSGVAEHCAPSDSPALWTSIAGLPDMLARGYVVVATDYQGLGNPGPHPYLAGPATGRAVLDSVRAAGGIARADSSGRYAVWGESQGGHAALWTGKTAAGYAPELKLVGIAAAAPPTDLTANLTGGANGPVRALLTAYTGASWSKTYNAPLSAITGPVGRDLITRLARNCVSLDGFKVRTQVGLVRLTAILRGVDISQSPPWAVLLRRNSATPEGLTMPVLIAQGGKDPIVAPAVTRDFANRLCRNNRNVRYLGVPDGDHITIAKRTSAATLDWLGDRFAARPAPNDCGRF